MMRFKRLYLLVAALIGIIVACAAPPVSTPDPNALSTFIAQTVIAGVSQSAVPLISSPTFAAPSLTFTPEPPTLTPTETATATLAIPPTSTIALISVSVNTNCRIGPGRVYDRVGALLVGETAEVYGRNPTGEYWYIRNPDSGEEFCWLWGEYATLVGNTTLLPVYTPPPTPTPAPAFQASFDGLDTCVGWWVELELENTGGVTFSSMSLTIRDTVTDVVLSQTTDNFTNLGGCSNSNTVAEVTPGSSPTVSSPPFAYNPAGHKLRATVTLCSGNAQTGVCISDVTEFTP
ncbi:MAG: SH3 domain-containing protein [Anaerolineales bacterium]